MAGGWLGVKSMPLSLQGLIIGKLASPTFKWAWPKRVQRALNVKASNQIQPSHQPSRGWVANGFVCKVGRVIFFLQVMGNFFFCIKKGLLVWVVMRLDLFYTWSVNSESDSYFMASLLVHLITFSMFTIIMNYVISHMNMVVNYNISDYIFLLLLYWICNKY